MSETGNIALFKVKVHFALALFLKEHENIVLTHNPSRIQGLMICMNVASVFIQIVPYEHFDGIKGNSLNSKPFKLNTKHIST